jgi:hypothetical protein
MPGALNKKDITYKKVVPFLMRKGNLMKDFNTIQEWRENYYNKLFQCRNEMMTDFSMSQAYNGRTFKAYMEQLIGTHGKDCVSFLLTNTIRSAEWDGRYDHDVKSWAKTYPEIAQPPTISKEKMSFHELRLNEHPCILNQAARITIGIYKNILPPRKEQER